MYAVREYNNNVCLMYKLAADMPMITGVTTTATAATNSAHFAFSRDNHFSIAFHSAI